MSFNTLPIPTITTKYIEQYNLWDSQNYGNSTWIEADPYGGHMIHSYDNVEYEEDMIHLTY